MSDAGLSHHSISKPQACTIAIEAAAIGDDDLAAFATLRSSGQGTSGVTLDALPGSVAVGRVEAPDAEAKARGIKIGDRVAIRRAELDDGVPGLYQREVKVPGARLHPLPARWNIDRALAAGFLAFAIRTIRAVPWVASHHHAVIGLSPTGMFVVRLLAERGAASITAVDADATRRDAARALGATEVITPDGFESGALNDPAGRFDTIYDLSNNGVEFASTRRAIGHLGTVVAAGRFVEPDIVIADYYREIIIKESTIIGVCKASATDWAAAIAYLDLPTTRVAGPFLTLPANAMMQERLDELIRIGLSTGITCMVFAR